MASKPIKSATKKAVKKHTPTPAAAKPHTGIGNINVSPATASGVLQQVTFSVANWGALPAPAFTTLCDSGQFTITQGYTKINVVDVPQRVGTTVFSGFDPITATVPLIFDLYGFSKTEDTRVEQAINRLEWMAGLGTPLEGERASAEAGARPWAVYVYSNDANGQPSNLIPVAFRSYQWFITGLGWGDSLRDAKGNRQRQKVTVTLMQQHGPADSPYSGARAHKKRHGAKAWKNYKIPNEKYNTPRKITTFILHAEPRKVVKVANEIKTQNAKLHIKSIDSPIKVNTTIKVPTKP